jgi:hypothetical protein
VRERFASHVYNTRIRDREMSKPQNHRILPLSSADQTKALKSFCCYGNKPILTEPIRSTKKRILSSWDEWVAWEAVEGQPLGARGEFVRCPLPSFSLSTPLCKGDSYPRDLRTAHCRGRRISLVVIDRPMAGYWSSPLSFLGRIFLGNGWHCLEN